MLFCYSEIGNNICDRWFCLFGSSLVCLYPILTFAQPTNQLVIE